MVLENLFDDKFRQISWLSFVIEEGIELLKLQFINFILWNCFKLLIEFGNLLEKFVEVRISF